MPDGKRRRRHSANLARREWYALHRTIRFRQRFGLLMMDVVALASNVARPEARLLYAGARFAVAVRTK